MSISLGQLAGAQVEDLETLSDTELIGYLAQIEGLGAQGDPSAKANAKARITAAMARKSGKAVPKSNNLNGETRFLTDKALFENRLSQLDPAFVKKLKNGQQQAKCIMCNYCGLVIEKEPTRCLYGRVK